MTEIQMEKIISALEGLQKGLCDITVVLLLIAIGVWALAVVAIWKEH